MPEHARRGTDRVPLLLTAVGLLLVLLGVLVVADRVRPAAGAGTAGAAADGSRLHDAAGHVVVLGDGVLPTSAQIAAMHPDNDLGARFRVDAVGLDVPLGALTMVGDEITPPGITSAYTVRNLGVPLHRATRGTVYVVMHSLHGGGVGPGNALLDVAGQRSSVTPGATLVVGSRRYRAVTSSVVDRRDLPQRAGLWRSIPGRLVAITCLQNVDGTPATRNLVIEATLDRLPGDGQSH